MTEPMSVLHLTGKDPSSGEIKTFDFEIVDEVARRQKADKADTVQETTLSRGRKEGTEVGEGSVAFGTDVEASGEGSHAEGNGTIANAPYMYAFGEYNTPAEVLPEWVAETEYATGDKVIYDGKAYVCDTANSDAEFDPAKWTETDMPEAPVFVIGNGTSENSRGDAFAVERDGDVKAGGDLYTNYDPATGTGKKVATEDYVGDLIGDVVSMEYAVADELPATGEVGTIYLIPNGETSGTDTHDEYIWVPATESFEKIGNTKVDLSDYALKTDTVLNTTLSMGRKANTTVGQKSTALGKNVTASGQASHAEGEETTASGNQSHAEGLGTTASGDFSHAEGVSTTASDVQAHAEGYGTHATATCAHAEGSQTTASRGNSHAEGSGTTASGASSHAEGSGTLASGNDSHAEGSGTIANGNYMHAQGIFNKSASLFPGWVSGTQYAVGDKVIYNGSAYKCRTANTDTTFTTSKWDKIPSNSDVAFVIGNGTADGARSDAFLVKWDGTVQEGAGTTASGASSHAEGASTTASGNQSHAEGGGTQATGGTSHAEGGGSRATGGSSHAEGAGTQASGSNAHAEGGGTQATGGSSHAEGSGTKASGVNSHAEGVGAQATGDASHVEGNVTLASGGQSHAEGDTSQATGNASHAEGSHTIANGFAMHAQGKYNKPDDAAFPDWVAGKSYAVGDKVSYIRNGYTCKTANSDATFTASNWTQESSNGGEIAFVIGNGTNSARSNAFVVKWNGAVQEGSATASGPKSHAEGAGTTASGSNAHAEGGVTTASGPNSHAEGTDTLASAGNAHAEGIYTIANGFAMHAQGMFNKPDDAVYPDWVASKSYAVGDKVTYNGYGYTCKKANSDATFDGSKWTQGPRNGGEIAFVIGNSTSSSNRSNALTVNWDGTQKIAGDLYTNYDFDTNTGNKVATEAYVTEAIAGAGGGGSDEYALKTDTVLETTLSMGRKAETNVGQNSVALGNIVEASGVFSFATGNATTASGAQSHAEGGGTQATGSQSHAEGGGSRATGVCSHAEGSGSQASGDYSHAEGGTSQATGMSSHAEGAGTQASGGQSHAEGNGTIANGVDMHAQGKFNKPDDTVWADWVSGKSYAVGDKVTYAGNGYTCKTANSNTTFTSSKWTRETSNGDVAFVIGNGTADDARSNAFAVKWDGTLIMRDVSNGAYYKVYIDGGVLKTEAVV